MKKIKIKKLVTILMTHGYLNNFNHRNLYKSSKFTKTFSLKRDLVLFKRGRDEDFVNNPSFSYFPSSNIC